MVMLPLMSARTDFKEILKKMGLQARGTGGVDSASTGGTWDISNADRIGKGEVRAGPRAARSAVGARAKVQAHP